MTRVAVTTTRDTAPRLARPLLERGLHPVLLPCVRVEASAREVLAGLREAAVDADWIVVTSPRAVRLTWPDPGMPSVPAAAVGPATAAAVADAGGRPELVGDGGVAALVDLLAPRVAGRRVVFPHARDADPHTAERLRAAGAEIVAAVAYRTVPLAPAPEPVEAVVFGSPSAVTGWCASRSLDGLAIAVMGGTTAAAVREHGREPDVMPPRPGFTPLVEALADHLRERSIP